MTLLVIPCQPRPCPPAPRADDSRWRILNDEGDAVGIGVGKLEGEIGGESADVDLSGAERAAGFILPPSVSCKRLSSSLVEPLNFMQPGLLNPRPKLIGVVPLGLML